MNDADRDAAGEFDRDRTPTVSKTDTASSGEHSAPGKMSEADAPLPPGSTIGGYRVIRLLGRGGFGCVYLALDVAPNRQVALKVPRPDTLISPRVAESFRNEVQALIQLKHPHVVQVYAASDQPPLIAMQYIEGRSLAEILRDAREGSQPWPDPRQAAAWVAAVAEALSCAHRGGLVHRDVKPHNILIDNQREAYLTDFGLTLREELYGQKRPAGMTLQYMSPEQARGLGHGADGRSDIYSLGAVFYELLTQRQTFSADPSALVDLISKQEVRPPRLWDPAIPGELSRICRRALANDPEHRYESAADLARELREFLAAPLLPAASPAESAEEDPTTTSPASEPAVAFNFRRTGREPISASHGELVVTPVTIGGRQRRDLAKLALERGIDAFSKGDGPIRQIALPGYPTLDDLLAAEYLKRLVAGEKLPQGCAAFAEYAKLVREGLRPGEVPPQRSLEGVFLAMVNDPDLEKSNETYPDPDLTQPGNEEQFGRSWARLARQVMAAARQGLDPFSTPLCDGPEFARERTFLARDRDVYRQDIERGERWTVRVPGGPPRAAGLLLRSPKSLLFKHWPRVDDRSPTRDGYLLLLVRWAAGDWVISTDPIHRLSLKSLAEALQAAEGQIDADSAAADPWFDGAPFHHTLIAAPHGRSKVSDEAIIGIVKGWCSAHPVSAPPEFGCGPPINRRRVLVSGLSAGAASVMGIGWWRFRGGDSSGERDAGARADAATHDARPGPPEPVAGKPNLYVVSVGVSDYPNRPLPWAVKDARALAEAFAAQAGRAFDKVEPRVVCNEKASKNDILEKLNWLQSVCTPHDLAIVTFSGHGIADPNMDFIFLAHRFDPARQPAVTGLTKAELTGYLRNIRCHRIVIMDTCHSGQMAANGLGEHGRRGADPHDDPGDLNARLERQIAGMYEELRKLDSHTVIFAACLSNAVAWEHRAWGHGALTLAVLEAIQGKYLYRTRREQELSAKPGGKQTLTVKDLDYYVSYRVNDLTANRQSVVVSPQGQIPLHRLPIAILDP